MASLVSGSILQGSQWDYRILDPVKGDNSHASNVFKAEVIPREKAPDAPKAPRWAVIKAVSPVDEKPTKEVEYDPKTKSMIINPPSRTSEHIMADLDREIQAYRLPGIASAECFRKMYDVINDRTIALEWLDTTLQDVKYKPEMGTYSLILTVLRASLSSCLVLEGHKCVNTDYKPANILLSGIETGHVTAKVGDLGQVHPTGRIYRASSYAMRSPEVFLGLPCTEPSQIWAVAAMLLCWIKPRVLGAQDCLHWLVNEAWSMAKIKRLFPHWIIPTADDIEGPGHALKSAVTSAQKFSVQEDLPELQAILPFDEETKKVEMPQQLRDLLRFMLRIDHTKRPSASSVLASAEFRAFEEIVDV